MRTHAYCVCILSSRSGVLYIGVTNDLARRMSEHKSPDARGFAGNYNVNRLVYFEETSDVEAAIWREKQLKGWRRAKKVALIESVNPGWKDLAAGLRTD